MAKKKREWLVPMSDEAKRLFLVAMDDAEQAVIAADATLKDRQRDYDLALILRDALAGAVETARAQGLLTAAPTESEEITP